MNDFEKDLIGFIPILKGYALKLTHNEENANDLMQDTLLKALRKKHLYKKNTNFKAWLMTIMKNIFFDSLKHKNFNIRSHSEDIKNANEYKVNNKVFENLSIEEIKQEIQNLTDYQKTMFELFLKGYSGNEIAEKLNKESKTIRTNTFYIKQILKQRLKELGYENN